MLHRIIGSAGSGKTEYMLEKIKECLKKKQRVILLVPEQMSLDYEALLCDRFGNECNMYCEVLNFERLPNRIAREYGNLALDNIDKGGACALLSVTAEKLKDRLKEYKSVACDTDFAKNMLALINRFKMSLVTPEMLTEASKNPAVSENSRLCSKLSDIALIYSEYQKNFTDGLYDPRDALTRLAEELPEKRFFKGSRVFIDGYYNFTNQEYSVIKEIISQSRDTYISFTFDDDRSFFKENRIAAERIKNLPGVQYDDYYTGYSRRSKKDDLMHLEKNLFAEKLSAFKSKSESIKIIKAENKFDEAEAAANEILSFVRAGNRFSDVSLMFRHADSYQGIIESVFENSHIPYNFSVKENLLSKPLFSFVCASLEVIIDKFSCKSIKKYIKTGYTELTLPESDVLLSYAESWKIKGKRWYDGEDWGMDPEGYRSEGLSENGIKILKEVNRVRAKLVLPLSDLKDSLNVKNITVRDGLKALYDHLIFCKADEKLLENAEKKLKNNDREGSERDIQLWKILINIFDQLDRFCGTCEITVPRLLSLIKLMSECYSLGAIPSLSDAVNIGQADIARAGNCKLLIIIGANDGEFPSKVSGGTFFTNDEAVLLEDAGCDFSDSFEKLLNRELFLVYSAFSSPKEKLCVIYPKSDLTGTLYRPSVAVLGLMKMFPDARIKDFSLEDMIYSRETAASFYPVMEDGEIKNKVRSLLKEKDIPFYEEPPKTFEPESKISFNKDSIVFSPTKIEQYMGCPFSYFGTHLLHLKEKNVYDWSTPDTGTFIHKILEIFVRECVKSGKFVCPDDNVREEMIKKLAHDLFFPMIPKDFAEDNRFLKVYDRMLKILLLVSKDISNEISDGKFVPVGFEYSIGIGRDPDMPAVEYDVENKKVYLHGSIDRVDTYEKDGITYVKIVDYKTYKKKFDFSLVNCGFDTQMLYYLFAYCKNNKALPAAAVYYTVVLPYAKEEEIEDISDTEPYIMKDLLRTGAFLDDEEIMEAMSASLKYVNGSGKRKPKTISSEKFDEYREKLNDQIVSMSEKIFKGITDIAPNDAGGRKDPCKYCKLKPICRYH